MTAYAPTQSFDAVDAILGGAATVVYECPSRARTVNRVEDVLGSIAQRRAARPNRTAVAEAPALSLYQAYTVTLVVDMSRATFAAVPNNAGTVVVLAERLPFIIRRIVRSLAYAKQGLSRARRDLESWRPNIRVQILAANCPHIRRDKSQRHVTFSTHHAPNSAAGTQRPSQQNTPTGGTGANASAGGAAGSAPSSSAARLDVIMPPTPVADLDSHEGMRRCDELLNRCLVEYRRRGLAAAPEDIDWCDSLDITATLERIASVVPASAAGERSQSVVVIGDVSPKVHLAVRERIVLHVHKLWRKCLIFSIVDLGYHNDADLTRYCTAGAVQRPSGHLGAFILEHMCGHIIRLPESQEEQPAALHYYRVIGLDRYTSQVTPDPQPDARLGLALTVQRMPALEVRAVAERGPPGPTPLHPDFARLSAVLRETTIPLPSNGSITASTALLMAAHSRGAHGWQCQTTFDCDGRMARLQASFLAGIGCASVLLMYTADVAITPVPDVGEEGTGSADQPRARGSVVLTSHIVAEPAALGVVRNVLDSGHRERALTGTEVLVADLCAITRELHDTEAAHLRICCDPRASLSTLQRISSFGGCATDVYSTFFVKFFTVIVSTPRAARENNPFDFLGEAGAVLAKRGWAMLTDRDQAPVEPSASAAAQRESGPSGPSSGSVAANMTAGTWCLRTKTVADTFLDSQPVHVLQAWQPKGFAGYDCYPVHLRLLMPHVYLDVELLTQLRELIAAFVPDSERFPGVSVSADETDLTGATIHRLIHRNDASAILTKRERRMETRSVESPFAFGGLLASSQAESMWRFDAGNFDTWAGYCSSFARLLVEWRMSAHLTGGSPFRLLYLRRGVAGSDERAAAFTALLWRPSARALDGESDEAVAEYHAVDCSNPDTISIVQVATSQVAIPATNTTSLSPQSRHVGVARRDGAGLFPAVDALEGGAELRAAELRRIVMQDAQIVRIGRAVGLLLSSPKALPFLHEEVHFTDAQLRGGSVDLPVSVRTLLPDSPDAYSSYCLQLPDSCAGLDASLRSGLRRKLGVWLERFIMTVMDAHWVCSARDLPKCLAREVSKAGAGCLCRGAASPMEECPPDFPTPTCGTDSPAPSATAGESHAAEAAGSAQILVGCSSRSGPITFWFVRRADIDGTPSGNATPMVDGARAAATVSLTLQSYTLSHHQLRHLCGCGTSEGASPVTRCSTFEDKAESISRVTDALQRLAQVVAATCIVRNPLELRPDGPRLLAIAAHVRQSMDLFRGEADVSHCLLALRAFGRQVGLAAATTLQRRLVEACRMGTDRVMPLGGDNDPLCVLTPSADPLPPQTPLRTSAGATPTVNGGKAKQSFPTTAMPLLDASHASVPAVETPPVLLSFELATSADGTGVIPLSKNHREIAAQLVDALAAPSLDRLVFVVRAWTFDVPLLEWAGGVSSSSSLADFRRSEASPECSGDDAAEAVVGRPFHVLPKAIAERLNDLVSQITQRANACVLRTTLDEPALTKDFDSSCTDPALLAVVLPALLVPQYALEASTLRFASTATDEERVAYAGSLLERLAAYWCAMKDDQLATAAAPGVAALAVSDGSRVSSLVAVRIEGLQLALGKGRTDSATIGMFGFGDVGPIRAALATWVRDDARVTGEKQLLKALVDTNEAADDFIPEGWGLPSAPGPKPAQAPFIPVGVTIRVLRVNRSVTAAEVVGAVSHTLDVMRIANRGGCYRCERAFFRVAVVRSRDESDPDDYLPPDGPPATPVRRKSVGSADDGTDTPLGSEATPPHHPVDGTELETPETPARTSAGAQHTGGSPRHRGRSEFIDLHLYGEDIELHSRDLKAVISEAHSDTVMRRMPLVHELSQIASTPGSNPDLRFQRCPSVVHLSTEETGILQAAPLQDEEPQLVAADIPEDHVSGFFAAVTRNMSCPDLCLCPIATTHDGDPSEHDSPLLLPKPADPLAAVNTSGGGGGGGGVAERDFILLMVRGDLLVSNIFSLRLTVTRDFAVELRWFCSRAAAPTNATERARLGRARDGAERAVRLAGCELSLQSWADQPPSPHSGGADVVETTLRAALAASAVPPLTDTPCRASATIYKLERHLVGMSCIAPSVIPGAIESLLDGLAALQIDGLSVTTMSCKRGWAEATALRGRLAWHEHHALQVAPDPWVAVVGTVGAAGAPCVLATVRRDVVLLFAFHAVHRDALAKELGAMLKMLETRSSQLQRSLLAGLGIHRRPKVPAAKTGSTSRPAVSPGAAAGAVAFEQRPLSVAESSVLPFMPCERQFRVTTSGTATAGDTGDALTCIVACRDGIDGRARFNGERAAAHFDREGKGAGVGVIRNAIHLGKLRGAWAGNITCNPNHLPWATSVLHGDDASRTLRRADRFEAAKQKRAAVADQYCGLRLHWLRRNEMGAIALASAVAETQQVSRAFHTARVPDTELDARQSFDPDAMGRPLAPTLDARCERTLHNVNEALSKYAKYLTRRFPGLELVEIDPQGITADEASQVSSALELRLRWRYGVLRVDNEPLQFQPKLRYFVLPVGRQVMFPAGRSRDSDPDSPHSPSVEQSGSLADILAAKNETPVGFIIVELGFTLLHYAVDIHTVCHEPLAELGLIAAAETIKEALCFSSFAFDLMVHRFISVIIRCAEQGLSWDKVTEETRLQAAVDRHISLHADLPMHVASALQVVFKPTGALQTFYEKAKRETVQGVDVITAGFVAPAAHRGTTHAAFYVMACVVGLPTHRRDALLDLQPLMAATLSSMEWRYGNLARTRDGNDIWKSALKADLDYSRAHRLLRLAKQRRITQASHELSDIGHDWAAACTGPTGTIFRFVRQQPSEWQLLRAPSGNSFILLHAALPALPEAQTAPDAGETGGTLERGVDSMELRCTAVIITAIDGRKVNVHAAFCDFQQVHGKTVEATAAEVEEHARSVERVLGLLTQAAFAGLL